MDMNDPNAIAREFFKHATMTDSLEEALSNPAPVKVGVDLDNLELLITVHDKTYFMDLQMAYAFETAVFLATSTIEAATAAREN